MGPPGRAPDGEDAPIKHVIAEYRHRLQQVTCVCGLEASTVVDEGTTSEWSRHVAANRPKRS
jgi:hypothetical protein